MPNFLFQLNSIKIRGHFMLVRFAEQNTHNNLKKPMNAEASFLSISCSLLALIHRLN